MYSSVMGIVGQDIEQAKMCDDDIELGKHV